MLSLCDLVTVFYSKACDGVMWSLWLNILPPAQALDQEKYQRLGCWIGRNFKFKLRNDNKYFILYVSRNSMENISIYKKMQTCHGLIMNGFKAFERLCVLDICDEKKSGRSSCLEEQAYLTGRLWGNWYFLHNLSPFFGEILLRGKIWSPSCQRKNLLYESRERERGSCSFLETKFDFNLEVALGNCTYMWKAGIFFPLKYFSNFPESLLYSFTKFDSFTISLWQSSIIS